MIIIYLHLLSLFIFLKSKMSNIIATIMVISDANKSIAIMQCGILNLNIIDRQPYTPIIMQISTGGHNSHALYLVICK